MTEFQKRFWAMGPVDVNDLLLQHWTQNDYMDQEEESILNNILRIHNNPEDSETLESYLEDQFCEEDERLEIYIYTFKEMTEDDILWLQNLIGKFYASLGTKFLVTK